MKILVLYVATDLLLIQPKAQKKVRLQYHRSFAISFLFTTSQSVLKQL